MAYHGHHIVIETDICIGDSYWWGGVFLKDEVYNP